MTNNTKSVLWWIFAVLFTLAIAYYQRTTGPTYPVRGKISVNNQELKYKLLTSNESHIPAEIVIKGNIEGITGHIEYKKYNTNEEWQLYPNENKRWKSGWRIASTASCRQTDV